MTSLDDAAGLRLTISDETAVFALTAGEPRSVLALFLGVPHRALRPPSRGVRLAPDRAPLRPDDDGATIADLGLGRSAASFAVRTRDSRDRGGVARRRRPGVAGRASTRSERC